MNKRFKHTIQSLFTLLLLAVFVGSMLIKPVHVLLAHHDSTEGVCENQHEIAFTTDHYKDCPICDFEFCTFIPVKSIRLPQITAIVRNEQTQSTVACLAGISTHLFQLRAPPAR